MTWIQTYTGLEFDFTDPSADAVCIEDIAHALSNICRYTGHSRYHYSVAQHSVMCSRMAPEQLKFVALMHDAAEAYINDISRPMKMIPELKKPLRELEHNVWLAIAMMFGLPYSIPDEVKEVDLRMLATEAQALMGRPPRAWGLGVEPYRMSIHPWSISTAREVFMDRFHKLKGIRDGS